MKSASSPTNLITEQRNLLKKIYNQGQNLWKILIFDNFNRDINSALFKMKDLRESNITLYFHIKDYRQQLHGVTAIYLVQPNQENLNKIIQDFEQDLYSSVIIHFSSEPQAHIVSTFAKNIAKNKPAALTKISKVEYSCLGFNTSAKNMAVMEGNNEIINLISLLKYFCSKTDTNLSLCMGQSRNSKFLSSGKDCSTALYLAKSKS